MSAPKPGGARRDRWLSVAVLSWFLACPAVFGANSPALSIQWQPSDSVRLSWTNDGPLILEEASALGSFSPWKTVFESPVVSEGQSELTLGTSDERRFFRLRTPELTTISEVSPANGESGVSVTRETIFRFNYPLSTNTFLGANHVYAELGGRRSLSRVELSTDRKTVTLFYLEPLPGSARMQVTFDAFGLMDGFGRLVDLDGDGVPGGAARFEFDTLSLTPLPGAGVIGTVYASEQVPGTESTNFVNRPLAGVTVTVDGMEQTLRAVTDSNGFFRLSPCPVGDFFVHIDGRTVTNLASGIRYPDQAYYPFVGKSWKATAGNTNNFAGGTGLIYLPLVAAGTLQPVSATEETMITFPPSVIAANPALAGARLMVPANSLYSDSGTRGGRVGIAPVPADRLPGPLPPGLELPLVFTVQTDGPLNFDRPAPVCLPNLPDPALGTRLPPGSKQALVTFSHDKGIWEAVGTMTVSADGTMVCTDPGVGVLSPGWGGVAPVPAQPPPPECPNKPNTHDPRDCGDRQDCADAIKKHQECISRVERDTAIALALCSANFVRDSARCAIAPPPADGVCEGFAVATYALCGDAALFVNALRLLDCNAALRRACNLDMGSARLAGPIRPQFRDDPVTQQIVSLLTRSADLALPYLSENRPIPLEFLAEIHHLHRDASDLAGGDATAYLEQFGLMLELETPKLVTGQDEPAGNAPAYPILYVATIEGSIQGQLVLRGTTYPLAQYSIFLPRNSRIREVSFYDPNTKWFGTVQPRIRSDALYQLPSVYLAPLPSDAFDSDRDGLPNQVEFVIGTSATNPDSDNDGIPDGAEIAAGADPLDGRPAIQGVVAAAATAGRAVDVHTANDLAIVAMGDRGVGIFDIASSGTPLILAQVDTPGLAGAVAGSGRWIVVADGPAGVAVIDAAVPASARVVHQIALPGDTRAVVACGSMAFAGSTATGSGEQVTQIDLETARIVRTVPLTGFPLQDLALRGQDYLYVLQTGLDGQFQTLRTFPIRDGELTLQMHTLTAQGVNYTSERLRLSVAGDVLVSAHSEGYTSFDLANPAQPTLRRYSGSNGDLVAMWQLIPSGGQPTLIVNGRPGERNLKLADMGDWSGPGVFLTQFTTSGRVNAASLYQDRVYVADDVAGLLVVNYRQPALANPGDPGPAFTLRADFPLSPPSAEANRAVRVTADVAAGVQVRQVEFLVNGVRIARDGTFPFETCFRTPALGAGPSPQFVLTVLVTDTSGRSRTETVSVALVGDRTSPRVTDVTPMGGARTVTQVTARFSDVLDVATVNSGNFQLTEAGPDGRLDTPDDVAVTGGTTSYEVTERRAVLEFGTPLPDGFYRAKLLTALTDPAGNRLPEEVSWSFVVADAVFWTSPYSGNWHEPLNWSTGTVPGPDDHVVILATAAALGSESYEPVTVTVRAGPVIVRSVQLFERLDLINNVTLNAERITCHDRFAVLAGTLRDATVVPVGAGHLFIGNAVLDAVKIEGDLEMTGITGQVAPFATVEHGLFCSGTISLNGAGLAFSGDQTLAGGTVQFGSGPANGRLQLLANTTLTLDASVTVRGRDAFIGFGSGVRRLINWGTILADQSGGSLTLDGAVLRNEGLLNAAPGSIVLRNTMTTADLGVFRSSDGGQLELRGTLDNTGSNLVLDDGTGALRLLQSTIRGGTITQTGTGRLLIGEATLDAVTVQGDLDLTALPGQSSPLLQIEHGLVCTGTIQVRGGVLVFQGDQTFDQGVIAFGDGPSFGHLQVAGNSTVTLGAAVSVRGRNGVVGSGSGFGPRALINRGLIAADQPGGALSVDGAALKNEGVLRAAGGKLSVRNTISTANLGWFETTAGQVELNGTLDNTGATLALNDTTGSLFLPQSTVRGGTVTQTGAGKLVVGNATFDGLTINGNLDLIAVGGQSAPFLQIDNGWVCNGTIRISGGLLVFRGTQTFGGAEVIFGPENGSLQIAGNTTLTLASDVVLRGASGFIGAVFGGGTHRLVNQGRLAADQAGGALTVLAADFQNDSGGSLEATVSGAVLRIRSTQFIDQGSRVESDGGQIIIAP